MKREIRHTGSRLHTAFAPRLGAPLLTAYECQEREKERRNNRARFDRESKEYKLLNALFYSSIVRKEYANEKLRQALAALQDNKQLYRHEVKRTANSIKHELSQWDIWIARAIKYQQCGADGERLLDYYDDLTAYANKKLDALYLPFYYSILQELTRLDCPFRNEAALLETAVTLQDFMQRHLYEDVGRYHKEIPVLSMFGNLLDERMFKLAEQLRAFVSSKAAKGKGEIDLNNAPNVQTAANNLLHALSSADTINGFIDATLAPHAEEISEIIDKKHNQQKIKTEDDNE